MLHIVAPKKQLVEAVAKVRDSVDPKSSMPALSNVLITAHDDVTFAATDLYQSTTHTVKVKPGRHGSIALPAKDLHERLKAMPDGDVELVERDGYQIEIKAVGRARKYSLSGIPGAEFPRIPEPPADVKWTTIKAGKLSEMLSSVLFAVSKDETRAHVNSLCFVAGDNVSLAATDGHRLALSGSGDGHEYLIPIKGSEALRRLVDSDGPEDDVGFVMAGHVSYWRAGGVEFSTKLVDAQFPPYKQIIPQMCERSAKVDREALIDAIRAVSLSARKDDGITLEFASGKITLCGEGTDAGSGLDEVAADYDGTTIKIGFSWKYLVDTLSAVSDDEVELQFGGVLDPIKVSDASGGSLHVLMPMRF